MSDEILQPTTPQQAGSRQPADWVQGFSPLSTGTRIGELTILSVLGAGEFGITYVTEHPGRGKRYVLKEYFPRTLAYRDGPTVRALAAGMPEFTWGLDRFLAEARALQRVRHPTVIAVHGVTEVGGTGYVGMTYEQGRDIGIWLHELRRPPTQEEIDKVVLPLVQGLDAAHAAGLVHQDIAIDTILIRDDGTPVVVDFGGCRVGMRRRQPNPEIARHPYVAPELLGKNSDQTGAWTDIYGLSAVLYHAVTGKPPQPADQRRTMDQLPPVATATEGRYRADFLSAIDSGLQLAPAARPATLAAWREELTRTQASRQAPKPSAAPEADASNAATNQRSPFDDDLPMEQAKTETLMENQSFKTLFYAIAGVFGGAIAGALAGILLGSLINPECATDNCVGPLLPAASAVGALIGIFVGARAAKQSGTRATGNDTGRGY